MIRINIPRFPFPRRPFRGTLKLMSAQTDIASALRGCEFFSDLSPELRETIAGACRARHVDKEECLFLEGRPGEAMYALAAGAIKLVKMSPEGREVVIRMVQPGQVFAEVMLFERDTYPVTAIACRKSSVYQLSRRDFRALLSRESFRDSFIAHLARRLRYLTDRILHVTTADVEARFFQFLRDQYGDRRECVMTMSKKDIAATIGITPETLSRLAARLKKQRKISWNGKTVKMLK